MYPREKKIFSYSIILGVLLKLYVNEYQHCSLKEIVSYIEAVKEESVEVSPGLGGESKIPEFELSR